MMFKRFLRPQLLLLLVGALVILAASAQPSLAAVDGSNPAAKPGAGQERGALSLHPQDEPTATALPRPPSEAGANYFLILGAILLVAIVLAGFLIGRQREQFDRGE